MDKIKEKTKALELRKKGLSYREILEEVPVAKSTLSLWLRDIELSKRQHQRLTEKKLAAAKKGAGKRRESREKSTDLIKSLAIKEIGNLTDRDLWMIGIALYWAEGSKQKNHYPSARVSFCNSDSFLIKTYLTWLFTICKISKEDIIFRIYLHENSKLRLEDVKEYWSTKTGFHKDYFSNVSWKKQKPKTKRKNTGENYYGLLSVVVRRSTNFNRKIAGWIEGIYNNNN